MHSAGRPALPDGENMAPTGRHLHSQELLRAAPRELRFQLRRSALGASPELSAGARLSRTPGWRRRRAGLRSRVGGPGGGGAQGRSSSLLGQVGEARGQIRPRNTAQRRLAVTGGFVTRGGGAMPFTARVSGDGRSRCRWLPVKPLGQLAPHTARALLPKLGGGAADGGSGAVGTAQQLALPRLLQPSDAKSKSPVSRGICERSPVYKGTKYHSSTSHTSPQLHQPHFTAAHAPSAEAAELWVLMATPAVPHKPGEFF